MSKFIQIGLMLFFFNLGIGLMVSLGIFGIVLPNDSGWTALGKLDSLQYSSDQVESEGDWTLYIAEAVKALWVVLSIFARWSFALPVIMNGIGFPYVFVAFSMGCVAVIYIMMIVQILGSVRLG